MQLIKFIIFDIYFSIFGVASQQNVHFVSPWCVVTVGYAEIAENFSLLWSQSDLAVSEDDIIVVIGDRSWVALHQCEDLTVC